MGYKLFAAAGIAFFVAAIGLVLALVLDDPEILAERENPSANCPTYRFSPTSWQGRNGASRTFEAQMLNRCRLLVGRTRSEVRELLGAREFETLRRGETWRFQTRYIGGGRPPHGPVLLEVSFGTDGRVARTFLRYP